MWRFNFKFRKLTAVFSVACLLIVCIKYAAAQTEYKIDIKINYEKYEVYGTAQITYKNTGNKAINKIPLLLYPNSFLKKNPNFSDVNFNWVYPSNFEPGGMEIKSVKSKSADIPFNFEKQPGLAENVVVNVNLGIDLPPSESITLDVSYLLKIPKKFGPFGHYRDDIFLNGGFYPYIPPLSSNGEWIFNGYPEKSDFRINVEGEGEFLINGIAPNKDGSGKTSLEFHGIDYLNLFNTKRLFTSEVLGKRIKVKIFFHKREKGQEKELRIASERFIEFVERQKEFESYEKEIVISEAHLRDRLVQPSDGVLYFSDRLYKLFPTLRGYHSIEVIRGLFYELLRSNIREKENYLTYDWVLNTLAWHYTDSFIKDYYKRLKRDARDIKIVKLFSFLPEMDQVIYAPQFSFTSVYYNQSYSYDPFRLDILDYNNKVLSKRVVCEKIKDYYEEGYDLEKFYSDYLADKAPFAEKASEFFGESARQIFDLWTGYYPSVNYFIKNVEKKRLEDGSYETKVTVGRESKVQIEEPVDIYLEEWGGKDHLLKWDGKGDKKEFDLKTENRLRTVHIDPSGRLLETKLADNRFPKLYKLIITNYSFGLDLNAVRPAVSISTQFRRLYGSNNRYNFSGYSDGSNYGASFGYVRFFGRLLDSLRLSHGLGVYYSIDGLGSDYMVYRPSIDDPSSPLQVTLNQKGIAAALTLYYFFGSQISYKNPKEGMSATVFAGIGGKYLGGDFNFYRAGIDWTGVVPIDQNNILALKGEFGISGKHNIPIQQQFFLGGMSGMKGFAQGEIERIGRNRILLSAEYRHYLLKDIDINLGSLFRIRNIMGVLFADTGRVSASVAEYADHLGKGTGFDSNPLRLFNIKEYDADIGYGIRFLYDIFGVRESVLSFDAAKSLTNFHNNAVRFYVMFAQSF